MEVYVIIREQWDEFCQEDQYCATEVYGVFTNKGKAISVVKELSEKESYREDGIGDDGACASRGIEYRLYPCETDMIFDMNENKCIDFKSI